MKGWVTMLLLLMMALAGCGQRSGVHVDTPRPVGYHRITLYDSVYRVAGGVPVNFEINASTRDSVTSHSGASVGLNIFYPAYNAVVYCTFSPVDDDNRAAVVDNRRERMSLNTGGLPTEVTRLVSAGGYRSEMLFTPTGAYTPVQFLSVGRDWVVSGACAIEGAAERPDSLLPVLEAVRGDILHAIQSL